MAKALTEEQLNALEGERDGFINAPKNYRGLVARGLLVYRCGNNASMGYNITKDGERALEEAGR